jgi:hypothetical protein
MSDSFQFSQVTIGSGAFPLAMEKGNVPESFPFNRLRVGIFMKAFPLTAFGLA